ncbi:MAG: ATP-binding cassette domain-containing protein, partial [Planctomycetaceae bacterium]
ADPLIAPLWILEGVTLRGIERERLDAVSLTVRSGVTAIIGYSGAGKTSLLNVLVGFEKIDAGRIVVAPGSGETASDRLPLYWVPQNDGLWPHQTVIEHLTTVMPKPDRPRALALLHAFDLVDLTDARPDRLSLGERARLSVARALASGAAVLVMDEPLAHVDPARRGRYWQRIVRHCEEQGVSLVFSTHLPETVLAHARHAVCLKEGRVVYDGSVRDLYDAPPSEELATFLGPANWITADDARDWFAGPPLAAKRSNENRCVRPERLQIAPADGGDLVVEDARFAGSVAEVELRHETVHQRRRFFHRPAGNVLRRGDRVRLALLGLLAACLLVSGCGSAAPLLDVQSFHGYPLPPKGHTLPA